MKKEEANWQELVRQAREHIQADLGGRNLPLPEEILEQLREERLEQLVRLDRLARRLSGLR